ncbi:hypothetical protein HDU76_012827, partial [Blyttiomyces sp. JEL0837]
MLTSLDLDKQAFSRQIQIELEELGEDFAEDESSTLTDLIITMFTNKKTTDEMTSELSDLITNARAFMEWLLEYVEEHRATAMDITNPNNKSDRRRTTRGGNMSRLLTTALNASTRNLGTGSASSVLGSRKRSEDSGMNGDRAVTSISPVAPTSSSTRNGSNSDTQAISYDESNSHERKRFRRNESMDRPRDGANRGSKLRMDEDGNRYRDGSRERARGRRDDGGRWSDEHGGGRSQRRHGEHGPRHRRGRRGSSKGSSSLGNLADRLGPKNTERNSHEHEYGGLAGWDGESGSGTNNSTIVHDDDGAHQSQHEGTVDANGNGHGVFVNPAKFGVNGEGLYQQNVMGAKFSSMPPCRFGAGCTRADCKFAHPSPAAIAAMMAQSGDSKTGMSPRLPQCRYWPKCSKAACPFFHPLGGDGAAAAAVNMGGVQDISQIPCRFEPFCAKPNCPYLHSGPNMNQGVGGFMGGGGVNGFPMYANGINMSGGGGGVVVAASSQGNYYYSADSTFTFVAEDEDEEEDGDDENEALVPADSDMVDHDGQGQGLSGGRVNDDEGLGEKGKGRGLEMAVLVAAVP